MKNAFSSKPGVRQFFAAGCSMLACLSLLLTGSHAERWKPSQSTNTYYVHPDGGSPDQCTGLVNAPYPGSGTDQPCAWNHPFQALPPDGTPRIAGGDTLIIGAGSYMMGYGASGAGNCESDYPWGCHIPPIPSGPDPAHPTRILGVGWDSGCSDPPELWGAERADMILNLTDASNVEVACLEITDHSSCVEFHSGGLACERDSYPYGDWAAIGLYAEDSANVYLHDLNIHGLAAGGVHAGRLTDWTVEDVRIDGNGWVGWDGDLWEGGDSNSGTMTFRRWTVEWNGCGETYPGEEPTGCWAQTAGGYGDGVGTGATGGDWIIEDSAVLHNTPDGLDLLHVREAGSSIPIRRPIPRGHAHPLCRHPSRGHVLDRMPDGLDRIVALSAWPPSGVEAARVMIGRAILAGAAVTIVDEALDRLDAATARQVLDCLHRRCDRLIVIAHP